MASKVGIEGQLLAVIKALYGHVKSCIGVDEFKEKHV